MVQFLIRVLMSVTCCCGADILYGAAAYTAAHDTNMHRLTAVKLELVSKYSPKKREDKSKAESLPLSYVQDSELAVARLLTGAQSVCLAQAFSDDLTRVSYRAGITQLPVQNVCPEDFRCNGDFIYYTPAGSVDAHLLQAYLKILSACKEKIAKEYNSLYKIHRVRFNGYYDQENVDALDEVGSRYYSPAINHYLMAHLLGYSHESIRNSYVRTSQNFTHDYDNACTWIAQNVVKIHKILAKKSAEKPKGVNRTMSK